MTGDWSDTGQKLTYDRSEQVCELIDQLAKAKEENKILKDGMIFLANQNGFELKETKANLFRFSKDYARKILKKLEK